MNTHKLMNVQSVAGASELPLGDRKRHRSRYVLLAVAALFLFAGCVDRFYDGSGYYGRRYYSGRIHRPYYGIHHGIGHSGFGHGGVHGH